MDFSPRLNFSWRIILNCLQLFGKRLSFQKVVQKEWGGSTVSVVVFMRDASTLVLPRGTKSRESPRRWLGGRASSGVWRCPRLLTDGSTSFPKTWEEAQEWGREATVALDFSFSCRMTERAGSSCACGPSSIACTLYINTWLIAESHKTESRTSHCTNKIGQQSYGRSNTPEAGGWCFFLCHISVLFYCFFPHNACQIPVIYDTQWLLDQLHFLSTWQGKPNRLRLDGWLDFKHYKNS